MDLRKALLNASKLSLKTSGEVASQTKPAAPVTRSKIVNTINLFS